MGWEALFAAIERRLDGAPAAACLKEPSVRESIARDLDQVKERWAPSAELLAEFGEHLAERIASHQAELERVLPRLRVTDLFLAYWAGTGDRDGIAAFEATYAEDLDKVVARFRRLPADELRQRLRIKLFVPDAGGRVRVRDYSGFGFLQNWLRVTAVRAFVDLARSEKQRLQQERPMEPAFEGDELVTAAGDRYARAELTSALKETVAAVVAELPPRSRNYLRHAQVEKLTLDQIAALYHVHRGTVARVLAEARKTLAEKTRAGVAARLGIAADELESAAKVLDSRIDLSLSRVLRGDPPRENR